jgi:hypothetical protein
VNTLFITHPTNKAKAFLNALLITLLIAPLLWVAWFVIHFRAGGTLGGYGAGENDHRALWAVPAMHLCAFVAVAADGFIGWRTYRRKLRKYDAAAISTKPLEH